MENNPTTEIYEYLKKMAASIVEKDPLELNSMKDELKEYAQSISSQILYSSTLLTPVAFEN